MNKTALDAKYVKHGYKSEKGKPPNQKMYKR